MAVDAPPGNPLARTHAGPAPATLTATQSARALTCLLPDRLVVVSDGDPQLSTWPLSAGTARSARCGWHRHEWPGTEEDCWPRESAMGDIATSRAMPGGRAGLCTARHSYMPGADPKLRKSARTATVSRIDVESKRGGTWCVYVGMEPTSWTTSMTMWVALTLGVFLGVVLSVTWVLAVRHTRWAAGVTAVAMVLGAVAGVATLVATTIR